MPVDVPHRDIDGRSPRFLTRAQKWAITNESAPSSSKKWLSTDRRVDAQEVSQHLAEHPLGAGRRAGAPILDQRTTS